MSVISEDDCNVADTLFDEEDHDDGDDVSNDVAHEQLLQNINQLDSKRAARWITQRSEPSAEVSEFHAATGEGAAVSVTDLLSSLGDKAKHATLKKEVNRASGHRPLSTPLEKPQAARLQRAAGYKKVSEEVSRWENLVKQRRRAPHLSFPLEKPQLRVETAAERTAGFVPQTPLEQEIAALLGNSASVVPPGQLLSEAEKRALSAMSLDEALERRRMLAKHRALLTYQEAKNRRQNKIKSRKYHRILKKERIKQHLQEFEKLKICDPEAALAKLKQLEQDRAEERVNQKHSNTGKWARLMALKRKYDPAAREALAENIRLAREKTQKPADKEPGQETNNDGDGDSSEDEYIEEVATTEETGNPPVSADDPVSAYSGEYDRFWADQEEAKRRLREAEKAEMEREHQEKEEKPAARATAEDLAAESDEEMEEGNVIEKEEVKPATAKKTKGLRKKVKGSDDADNKPKTKKKSKKVDADGDKDGKKNIKRKSKAKESKNIDDIFDNYEKKIVKQTAKKLKRLMDGEATADKLTKRKNSVEQPLEKRNKTPKAPPVGNSYRLSSAVDSDDEAPTPPTTNMDETSTPLPTSDTTTTAAEKPAPDAALPSTEPGDPSVAKPAQDTSAPMLDPSQVLSVLPRDVKSQTPTQHTEDNLERRMTIAEAFADDDVIAEFRAEKEAAVESNTPKDIDMTLPGWGEWGGQGIKVSAQKRRRLMFRAPKGGPRKDHTLGHVILSEKRNEAIRAHQPSELPHYIRSVAAFEASIRAPIGTTWLPANAHQKLTRPQVTTRAGTVIKPMDESELLLKNGTRGKKRRRKGV